MANDVTLPLTGSGDATAVAATDQVSGRHYQIVKLADGAEDGEERIGGSAANGLEVDVTRVQGTVAVDASGAAVPVTDDGGSLTVDGSVSIGAALPAGTNAIGKLAANSGVDIGDVDVTSVVPGTGATALGKAEDAVHASGDTGVMALGVRKDTATALAGTDGDYAPFEVDASGRVHVTNSGGVGGTVAHDAADSGNPVGVGLHARTTNPTAVGDGDRVRAIGDDVGRTVVVPHQVRDLVDHQHTEIANSAAETTIVTAPGSGVFADLLALVLTNQSATAVVVTIKDATAGTTRMKLALAANGGAVLMFPAPVKQATANNNWTATLSVGTVTVDIFAQYVRNV